MSRLGDAGPSGRLLGDRQHARMALGDGIVQMPQKFDRLDVFAAAVAIRDPLAGSARVIAIEERCDRIHAQAVDVIALNPVQRAREQEGMYFMASEVKERGIPLRMKSLARIGMLVQRRAVE